VASMTILGIVSALAEQAANTSPQNIVIFISFMVVHVLACAALRMKLLASLIEACQLPLCWPMASSEQATMIKDPITLYIKLAGQVSQSLYNTCPHPSYTYAREFSQELPDDLPPNRN
jgi:hypothetical protein